ncbi:hypothetical protein DDI74_01300 [Chryseobacterium gleum]|nr:hypothetical protein DDI74_01300 [Chryseobacterium gleum]
MIWNLKLDFKKNKKQVPQFFLLFAKKAREFLDVQLEKFVYTKTHLAVKIDIIFQRSKNRKQKLQ